MAEAAPRSQVARLSARLWNELGFEAVAKAPRDVLLLLLSRFIRMFAYGGSTLVLALYFSVLGFSDSMIGLFMTLTLAGDVVVSLILTVVADQLGRRRVLLLGALLMVASGVVFALSGNYWVLLLAAVIGVISPSGSEIGPFRAVEESVLAHLTSAKDRSDIFAVSAAIAALGGAAGSLVCGWVTEALQHGGWDDVSSFRLIFWIYAGIGALKAILTLPLSAQCELQKPETSSQKDSDDAPEREPLIASQNRPAAKKPDQKAPFSKLSKNTVYLLVRLCALFVFDSFGSGMVPNSLIAYFIWRKFGMPQGKLGSIIAAAQFVSSIGNIFASTLAKRIGLINTMVFTHLPSAVFLALIPAPASLALTIVFLVGRSSLSSMDQAPRSAFLAAAVRPDERTAVLGIVNTVKTMSQGLGPLTTGFLAESGSFWVAFVVAGSLKVAYDIGLLAMFASMRVEGDTGHKGGRGGGETDSEQAATERTEHDEDGEVVEGSAAGVAGAEGQSGSARGS